MLILNNTSPRVRAIWAWNMDNSQACFTLCFKIYFSYEEYGWQGFNNSVSIEENFSLKCIVPTAQQHSCLSTFLIVDHPGKHSLGFASGKITACGSASKPSEIMKQFQMARASSWIFSHWPMFWHAMLDSQMSYFLVHEGSCLQHLASLLHGISWILHLDHIHLLPFSPHLVI